jgi:predicted adenine nucleotide alpha hydrolase (AANH) superfamily ATPase
MKKIKKNFCGKIYHLKHYKEKKKQQKKQILNIEKKEINILVNGMEEIKNM